MSNRRKRNSMKRFFAFALAAAVTVTSSIPTTWQPVYAKEVDEGNPFGGQNVALHKTATVTSTDVDTYAEGVVVPELTDGAMNNWEPAGVEGSTGDYAMDMVVDLDNVYLLDHVKICWRNVASAKAYTLQVSTDGEHWTTVATVTDGAGKSTVQHEFEPTNARYVKVACTQYSAYNTYTIFEIEAYTIGGLSADAAEKEFLALNTNGAVAYASAETAGEPLATVNDGDAGTRWSSGGITVTDGVPETEPYCYIDLGEEKDFNEIRLFWEGAYASEFTLSYATDEDAVTDANVMTSGEGSLWTELGTYTDATVGEYNTYTFDTVTARYVKITGNKLASGWGMSLFEFEVNNSPAPPVEAVYLSQTEDYVFDAVGDKIKLYAQPLPANGEGADTVTWSSSNEDVATVEEDGTVTAVGSGTAYISATCGDVTGKVKVMLVTKLDTPVVTVEKTGDNLITVSWNEVTSATAYEVYRTVNGGAETLAYTATTLSYPDADVEAGNTYAYKVRAIQMSDGECTGVSDASAENSITIELGVTGVTLDKETAELEIRTGEEIPTTKLVATVTPDKATNKEVTWESSDPDVATVDAHGKVTAVAPGETTITVTTVENKFTDDCVVTVRKQLETATLSAEKTAAQEITLTWDADKNADTYRILRAAGKNGIFEEITVEEDAIMIADGVATYVDTIDENVVGNTYSYKVVAVPVEGSYYTTGNESNATGAIQIGQPTPFGVNVAEGKEVTATTSIGGCPAEKITDGDTVKDHGWWESEKTTAGNTDYTQTVTVDLGQDYTIDHVKIYWNIDVPAANYEIFVGTDEDGRATEPVGKYQEVSADRDELNRTILSDCTFEARPVRYITVDLTKVAAYDCYGIVELEAYTQGTVTAEDATLTGLLLSQTDVTLTKGEKYDLYAQKLPINAEENVVWSSSDSEVASVVNGKVTAVKPGVATIKATVGGFEKECKVVVTGKLDAPANVKATLEDTYEKSVILTWDANEEATAYDVYRTVGEETTLVATDVAETTYTDEAVEAGTTYSYQVVAKNPAKSAEDETGIALYENSDKSEASEVTIPVHVTEITLSKEAVELTILPGKEAPTETLGVIVTPTNATEKGATWTSDNEAVATVDANGKVTAVAAGTATITAKTKDAKSTAEAVSCTVTVKEKIATPDVSAELSEDEAAINVTVASVDYADTYTLYKAVNAGEYVEVEDAELTSENLSYIDEDITKGSSYSYKVDAVSNAQEKYITSDKSKATETILVPIHVDEITLNTYETKLTIVPEDEKMPSVELEATVTPDNATDKTVDWTSTNEEVATVENGVVTAVGAGTTTIIATSKDNELVTAECEITIYQQLATPELEANLSEDETEVTVSWGVVENAYSYKLYKAVGDDEYAELTDIELVTDEENGTVSYVDTALEKGNTYSYKVLAVAGDDTWYADSEAEASIFVPVHVDGVTLDTTAKELVVADEITLVATVTPDNASNKTVSFASDNEKVATVDENGKVTAKAVGQAKITVTTEDGSKVAECVITVKAVLAAPAVTATKANKDITVSWKAVANASSYDVFKATDGKTFTKVTTVTTTSYTDKNLAVGKYSYKVVAKGTGYYKDSAESNVASADIVVINVNGVKLSTASLTLNKGKSATLAATVSPANADNKAVSFKSSNTKVATVDANGKVTAKGKGTAYITVTTADGSKTAKCKVTVKVPATKIKLNTTKLYIVKGKSLTISKVLKATLTPSDSTDKVTWSVPKKAVVTVKSGKIVAGKKTGKATLTAKTTSGKKANVTVYVVAKAKKATSIKLSKKSLSLKVGKTATLKATVKPATTTDTVTWSTSSKKIATVDAFGTVTAKKKGSVTITAKTSSGKKATCKITIK